MNKDLQVFLRAAFTGLLVLSLTTTSLKGEEPASQLVLPAQTDSRNAKLNSVKIEAKKFNNVTSNWLSKWAARSCSAVQ